MNEVVSISDGPIEVRLLPRIGGSISTFRSTRGVEWLRPIDERSVNDPRQTACFPMVPFCNRIQDGKFRINGQAVSIAPNVADEAYPIHGSAWLSGWDVIERSADSVCLQYNHRAGEWPWSFSCEQRFSLRDGSLNWDFTLTNQTSTAMPSGFGLHPYFSNPEDAVLKADVATAHVFNRQLMPVDREPNDPAIVSLARGRQLPRGMNVTFEGWSRSAEILWPRLNRGLRISADRNFGHLHTFTPTDADFFCVEPVSHCVNAVNLDPDWGDTGLQLLEPLASLKAKIVLEPLQGASIGNNHRS